MIGKQKTEKDGYQVISVKISPERAEQLNAICETLGINSYQIFQMFFETLIRASSPMHELSPDIRKLMALMEKDAGWAEAFNLANPDKLEVAQCILILEQKGHKGFGAVMIDKPWNGMQQQTENVEDILERTFEVTMHGIYRRFRRLMGINGYNNLLDVLITLLDAQTILDLDEADSIEMKGEAMYDNRGRRIEYGKRTKSKQHRTPDSYAQDQRLVFDDFDRETGEDNKQAEEGQQDDSRR